MNNILHIINEYDSLKAGLKYIINNSTSNNAPYHNLNHMLTVTRHVYNALEFMNLSDAKRNEETLLAALFHDFNHSMGKEVDSINISYAKEGLVDFLKDKDYDLDINFMFSILDATQYPYVLPVNELNVYQLLIRDCDLCQGFEYDWIKQCILGLSIEMNYTFNDILKGNRAFITNSVYHTEYGIEMKRLHFDRMIEEMKILESIIL